LHARRFIAGVLLGLSLVAMLFAAADEDSGRARSMVVASTVAFALGLALIAAVSDRTRRQRKR
jgi:formate/nitrite transporter FocA (FNT family)